MKYIKFEEARKKIHELRIKSVKEYFEMFKNKQIPLGIPRNPNRDYSEFISWGDFLGNNNISSKDKIFFSYEECQDYLISIDINSKEKFETWRKYKSNNFVPSRPDQVYKNNWVSWGEFFKTGRVADIKKHNSFLSYEEAKEWLKHFKFKNESEFYAWAKTEQRPSFIPASPRKTYGKLFISMGDFLSNSNYHFKDYYSYNECKNFLQSLNFNSRKDFQIWITKNKYLYNVPSHPNDIYPEFEGWPEFLGYQRNVSVGEKTISSILATNNIQHKLQYTVLNCKDVKPLPFDVAIFKDEELLCLIEYHGVQHFIAIDFFGGVDALEETQKRDAIKKSFCEKNQIPLLEISYKEDLEQKLSEFLKDFDIELNCEAERVSAMNRNFLSFEKAKELIQEMNIKNVHEFKKLHDKRPFGIPVDPDKKYKNQGWISWGDFLGTNAVQSKKAVFVTFEDCKKWFKENNIKSGEHWKTIRSTKPNNIPSNPDKIYKNNWNGWKDFLS